ncbi:unnamed protein product [Phytomonas sp. EM1]|nr:unnamed protein product [Phytomonas sp. EM1]|eukprot:CCW63678.1 unnamed protein product [Phytomonas sp. isolate EM1]
MDNVQHPSTVFTDDEPWMRNNENVARLMSLFTQRPAPSLINPQERGLPLCLLNSCRDVGNEVGTPRSISENFVLPSLNTVRILNADSKPRELGGVWRGRYGVRPVMYLKFCRSAADGGGCSRCRCESELPLLSRSNSESSSPSNVSYKTSIPHPSRPFAPQPLISYDRRACRKTTDENAADDKESRVKGTSCVYCSVCFRQMNTTKSEFTERPRYSSPGGWIIFLERDECLARECIVEEWLEILLKTPLPAHFGHSPPPRGGDPDRGGKLENSERSLARHQRCSGVSQAHLRYYAHPALLLAIERLSVREFLARRRLLDEEDECFSKHYKTLGQFLRCVAPNGSTTRTYGFLRAWIARHRARKVVHFNQQVQLKAREDAARQDLLSELCLERHQLFERLVEAMEKIDRISILRMQLITSYSHGVIAIQLAEQVARFPVLFGCFMSCAGKRARINAHTAFHRLILQEEHHRRLIEREEDQEQDVFLTIDQEERITKRGEPAGRRAIEGEEEEEYWKLAWRVFLLEFYYTFRDVEQYEAATRDTTFIWVKKMPIESQE